MIGPALRERLRSVEANDVERGQNEASVVRESVKLRQYSTERTLPSGRLKSTVSGRMRVDPVENTVMIRLYLQRVNAGIGVPLESTTPNFRAVDRSLVKHPEKTFSVFAAGDSMLYAGIIDDSFLICEETDDDWKQYIGRIVIANVNGVTVVKRLLIERDRYLLRSESPTKYADIVLGANDVGIIQGVVLSAHNDIENYKARS